MRTKFLLFFSFLMCGLLNAQVDDTIRTLIITEVRLDDARRGYVEIANVGSTPLNLKDFEIGRIDAWTAPWTTPPANWMMLPDKVLQPGETFVIAAMRDYQPEMYRSNPEQFDPLATNKKEFWDLADIQIHVDESNYNPKEDSISPEQGRELLTVWSGRDCIYLRYHIGGDSAIIDQVNGIFGGDGNTRPNPKLGVDVAGVKDATITSTLVRKFWVKTGNKDFASAKGEDISESEWMPIPHQADGRWADNTRRLFWTAGFHGNAVLSENTLVPLTKYADVVQVKWNENKIIVPWGVRRDDSIMFMFNKVPGLAWHYHYVASYEDSAYVSARTGDSLTVYATGNELTMRKFGIEVTPASEDAKIVVPKKSPNGEGFYEGQDDPPYMVTDGLEMDTIGTLRWGGIGFATRIDTLFKYLEKPEAATWEIVYVDGEERTDLKHGDILKVTAADNSTKEYFIKVDQYRKSHNAFLSSITWPDIPADYKNVNGWLGDTVPNFSPTVYNYIAKVPSDVVGIPGLVGKNQALEGKHTVEVATNLDGSPKDQTFTFKSVAEDDTSMRTYTVQLIKEKDPETIQPWNGEAFISEWVFWEQWEANNWIEVVNPTPHDLNMSKYMFVVTWENNPADAIANTRTGRDEDDENRANWINRYRRYVPGYKWVDSLTWQANPGTLVPDLAVNPVVKPGDVFVIASIFGGGGHMSDEGNEWIGIKQADVNLSGKNSTYPNPWGETINEGIAHWRNANIFMFRIDNDSITRGLKNANDPNDFTLIDVLGNGDGSDMVIGGRTVDMIETYIRKPHIYKGNPVIKGSAGTTPEDSEWEMRNAAYYAALGAGWPDQIWWVVNDIGIHNLNEVTVFKSTVTSSVYKVSPGYGEEETIRGVIEGTTVSEFFAKLNKADAGQDLSVVAVADGSVLEGTDLVANGDTLVVKSADLSNTTKYILEVTEEGLNSDAVLVSEDWEITVEGDKGVIAGFDPEITFKELMEKIEVPMGATVIPTYPGGKFVSYKMLNYDTTYTSVLVSDQISILVTAENGTDKITYSLEPNGTESDAYVTSSVFEVDQTLSLIFHVPDGIPVSSFLSNVVPAPGATIEVQDKFGFVREVGNIILDDSLVVTAADGTTIRKYGLKMLGGLTTSDFAYVLSEVYLVDQELLWISGVNITTGLTVADFKANLIASTGATIAVTNATGQPKNSGTLAIGDLVKVISANGNKIVTYQIDVINSVDNGYQNDMLVYPNPSNGRFYISGLKAGYRIQIFNVLGSLVLEKEAVAEKDEISIQNEKSGLYFISVMDNNKIIGRFKVVKR